MMYDPDPSTELHNLAAENRQLRQKLGCLTEEANQNELVLRRFHDRELSLLMAEDLPQLLNILTVEMTVSFDLPVITLILHDPDHELRHLLLKHNLSASDFPAIRFLHTLDDLDPSLQRARRPRLGPYMGEDHRQLFPSSSGLRSCAILPLIRHDRLIGILSLGSRDPNRFTRYHASDFLHRMATIGAVCLESTVNREHLIISGLTDPLTDLHNRRYLERRLAEEVARALRHQQPLSCLFIDADHFKKINDQHGHAIGDRVLREIALRIRHCLRASDIATRYGGEEFALLLPQSDADMAGRLGERIRRQIAGRPVTIEDSFTLQITVSIGTGTLQPATMETEENRGEQLLAMADKALYRAKSLGRNRVERLDGCC